MKRATSKDVAKLAGVSQTTVSFVMNNTPKKLKTAAMSTALRADIDRVETQVAIALGASVQPLTRITPIVKITVMSKGRL